MFVFFFQAEDGIRDLVRSRGLGDVYKRQVDGPVVQVGAVFRQVAVTAVYLSHQGQQQWVLAQFA